MHFPELERITGFDTSRNQHTELEHFLKHACKDILGVTTPEEYLALAQRLGRIAANPDPTAGTYVHPRGEAGELAAFVSNDVTRRHTTQEGIYIVVRSRDYGAAHGPAYSLLVTMHGNKKKAFDNDTRVNLH